MTASRAGIRTHSTAIKFTLIVTAALGIGYPLVLTGIGQIAFPRQANGSLLTANKQVVGSALIGQQFSDAQGKPLPEYFQSRPSAAGDGYDAAASSGSNWGPEHPDLIAAIEERRVQISEFNNADPVNLPPDALTASASGLDPHISAAYAVLQVERVAAARAMAVKDVRSIVQSHIQGRDVGFIGEETVNVLELNLSLDQWGN